MSDDGRSLWWREADIPLTTNDIVKSLFAATKIKKVVTLTELHRITVASWCHRNKVRVFSANFCCSHNRDGRSPVQSCKEIKEDLLQDQLIVVLGSQYAELANNAKGLKNEIWVALRAVMLLCLLESWASPMPGAELTIETNREPRMRPAASIVTLLCSRVGAKN